MPPSNCRPPNCPSWRQKPHMWIFYWKPSHMCLALIQNHFVATAIVIVPNFVSTLNFGHNPFEPPRARGNGFTLVCIEMTSRRIRTAIEVRMCVTHSGQHAPTVQHPTSFNLTIIFNVPSTRQRGNFINLSFFFQRFTSTSHPLDSQQMSLFNMYILYSRFPSVRHTRTLI